VKRPLLGVCTQDPDSPSLLFSLATESSFKKLLADKTVSAALGNAATP
jgi:hypothetical protein